MIINLDEENEKQAELSQANQQKERMEKELDKIN